MSAGLDPLAVRRRAQELAQDGRFDLGVLAAEFGVLRADVDRALWDAAGGRGVVTAARRDTRPPPAAVPRRALGSFLRQLFGAQA